MCVMRSDERIDLLQLLPDFLLNHSHLFNCDVLFSSSHWLLLRVQHIKLRPYSKRVMQLSICLA